MMPRVRKLMAALLGDDDPAVRRQAAADLAGETHYGGITALAAALQDEDKGVRDAASSSLRKIGGQVVARIVAEYVTDTNIVTRNLAGDLLVALGEPSGEALLPYLSVRDHDVRKFAADIVGLVGARNGAAHLQSLLDDADANVVIAGIEALGNIRYAESVPDLIRVFREKEFARPSVTEALGKIGGEEASDFLVMSFYKGIKAGFDPIILFGIVESLGKIGDSGAFDILLGHVHRVKGKLRNVLLHSLVQIAQRYNLDLSPVAQLKEFLVEAFKDRDPSIKLGAARVLAATGGQDVTRLFIGAIGENEELDAFLLSRLMDRVQAFRLAVEALEKGKKSGIRDICSFIAKLAFQASKDTFRGGESISEELVDRAVTVVAGRWQSADEETHMAIVDALFRLDADRAVTFLDELLNEPDPWLRIHVIELLGVIEHREAARYIAHSLQDDDEMVRETAAGILQSKGLHSDPAVAGG